MPPQNKIDSEQRGVLDRLLRAGGHQWIRGFAGSGKSVLLMQGLSEAIIRNPGSSACVLTYTHSLKDMLRSGLRDNVRHVPVMTYHEFKSKPAYYDYIFVDEVQDLEHGILELLARNCRVLTVAGDEEQSIFENRVAPKDIRTVVGTTDHVLRGVYRLTEKLIKVVATILPGARILSAQNRRLQTEVKLGLAKAKSEAEELDWVWREAGRFSGPGGPSAILVPNHEFAKTIISRACNNARIGVPDFPWIKRGRFSRIDYSVANSHLAQNGIILRYLGNEYGELEEAEQRRIVFVMTYHSAKGLDFETVFLPGMDASLTIWKNNEDMERRLFFVAATRSRRNLFISYSGATPHRFVSGMPRDLIETIDIRPPAAQGRGDNFDDVF